MAIETFLIEEAEALITEAEVTDEWKEKVEKLGLEGQKTLLQKPEKSPIPFLRLKSGERRVYETLCPKRTPIKEYKESTIPLRVLSLIALAEQEGYFGEMEIWHNYSDPDPIVVGHKSTEEDRGDYYVNDGVFIIARWGDELRSFVELKQIAMEKWIKKRKSRLEKMLRNLEVDAEEYFDGGFVEYHI